MSSSVSAPVLWDGNGNFQDGALVGIQADAIVVGYVQKPAGPWPPPYPNPTQIQTLQVKDRRFGTLYLLWTMEQWQSAANITFASPTTEGTYSVTITGSPVSEITAAQLFNKVIDQVSIGGTVQDMATYTYTQNVGGLTGAISFTDPISPTAVIIVLFHSA